MWGSICVTAWNNTQCIKLETWINKLIDSNCWFCTHVFLINYNWIVSTAHNKSKYSYKGLWHTVTIILWELIITMFVSYRFHTKVKHYTAMICFIYFNLEFLFCFVFLFCEWKWQLCNQNHLIHRVARMYIYYSLIRFSFFNPYLFGGAVSCTLRWKKPKKTILTHF